MSITCPYCGNDAKLVTGREVYPHRRDLFGKRFYQCAPCDAYVGCHDGTTKPLGRLANGTLRRRKQEAHAAFDPLWKDGLFSRKDAYRRLAANLGIPVEECHIGMFDVEMCRRVCEVVKSGDWS